MSRLVRLLAREPWVGAAVVAIFVGLLVYAAVTKNTLLGTFLPALAVLVAAGVISLLTIATSVFELSVTTIPRVAAAAVFVGVPVGFVLTTHWPTTLSRTAARWCNAHFGHLGTTIAVTAAALGGIAAIVRLLVGIALDMRRRKTGKEFSGRWIRTMLAVYRGGVIAAIGTLVVGFFVERTLNRHGGPGRWVSIANERRGTLVVVLLVSVFAAAALIEEGMAAIRIATRKLLRN
jgi:hypothetical protein